MGREIRKVPPNWDHPKDRYGNPQAMRDETFEDAAKEWKDGFAKWEAGERPKYFDPNGSLYPEYWEWKGNPPKREYHRPWKSEEATWIQVWETISEGTPITPPFSTPEELIEFLVESGDFWDQKQNRGGWKRENAEAFVQRGWAPSMIVEQTHDTVTIMIPRDIPPRELSKELCE